MNTEINEKYEVIEMDQWPRKGTFQFFERFDNPPYISITTEFDITNFKKVVKENGWSFTYAFDYLSAKAMTDIPEFRVRILRSGELRQYETIVATIQVLDPKDGQVKNLVLPVEGSIEEFIEKAVAQQKEIFENPSSLNVYMKANMIQMTSLPWIPFTATNQSYPVSINGSPFTVFGKFTEKDGKVVLPVGIFCDHRFVDGSHVGMWYNNLQKSLNEIK